MGVDVLHVVDRESRLLQSPPDRAQRPDAARRGEGDVAGVGRGAVAHDLAERLRSTVQGARQRLQDQDPGPLPDHEAVAVAVEGA